IALFRACKCRNVIKTTLALIAIATPIIPYVAFEARKIKTANLKIAPMKLFHIACLAQSKANKAACNGACIYNSKKNGAIRIIYLLALLESYMYVKIGMENKEKIIVANAPEAKEILTACVIR